MGRCASEVGAKEMHKESRQKIFRSHLRALDLASNKFETIEFFNK